MTRGIVAASPHIQVNRSKNRVSREEEEGGTSVLPL